MISVPPWLIFIPMGGPQQPVRLSAEYPKVSSASADLPKGDAVTNVPHRGRAAGVGHRKLRMTASGQIRLPRVI